MGKRRAGHRTRVEFSPDFLDFFSDRHAATHAAFFIDHLKPGMTILDCGCGPGSITLDFAELVAPGKAIGVDIGPAQIEKAKLLQARRNVPNAAFHLGDVNALPFADDRFDALFAHGVIEYFRDPVRAFGELRRVLKPGGVLGARHGDWGGFLLATKNEYIRKAFPLFIRLMEKNGGDPFFGRNQVAYLRRAGFQRIEASASYDCWTATPETTRRVGNLMAVGFASAEFVTPVLDSQFADHDTLQKIPPAFRSWDEDPDVFAAEAWGEAVAWKE